MAGLHIHLERKHRLMIIIAISLCFFLAEIIVGFKTRSLALIADAFHYLNDLIGIVVALAALLVSERENAPSILSYGWHRASTVGAFFNGVFLLALGVSVLLQSLERFVSIERVENPFLVMIIGCVGLTLNIISLLFLHEHGHGPGHGHSHGQERSAEIDDVEVPSFTVGDEISQADAHAMMVGAASLTFPPHHLEHKHNSQEFPGSGRDLNMLGVVIHVLGDAINNIGVIVAAVVIWKTTSEKRFYADPAASLFIALMILFSSLPVVKRSGYILLQGAPGSLRLDDIKHDLEKIPGIESVHELHVWRLDQTKSIASIHVVVSDKSVSNFMEKAKTIGECLHAYGIHSATLQPELVHGVRGGRVFSTTEPQPPAADTGPRGAAPTSRPSSPVGTSSSVASATRRRLGMPARCQLVCGSVCENMTCCTRT